MKKKPEPTPDPVRVEGGIVRTDKIVLNRPYTKNFRQELTTQYVGNRQGYIEKYSLREEIAFDPVTLGQVREFVALVSEQFGDSAAIELGTGAFTATRKVTLGE